jgi:2-polyprenyl-3-methyl-5-hydroxy-6-metoxy-1,4-benzoquinol methylase
LEVGARDVNGSVRPLVEAHLPASYIGLDIEVAPRVDEVLDARHLIRRFGRDSLDAVISTELLEQVRDWRATATNMKAVLKPGGLLLITTQSRGFPAPRLARRLLAP